jgi:hypothetical protein
MKIIKKIEWNKNSNLKYLIINLVWKLKQNIELWRIRKFLLIQLIKLNKIIFENKIIKYVEEEKDEL